MASHQASNTVDVRPKQARFPTVGVGVGVGVGPVTVVHAQISPSWQALRGHMISQKESETPGNKDVQTSTVPVETSPGHRHRSRSQSVTAQIEAHQTSDVSGWIEKHPGWGPVTIATSGEGEIDGVTEGAADVDAVSDGGADSEGEAEGDGEIDGGPRKVALGDSEGDSQ